MGILQRQFCCLFPAEEGFLFQRPKKDNANWHYLKLIFQSTAQGKETRQTTAHSAVASANHANEQDPAGNPYLPYSAVFKTQQNSILRALYTTHTS